VAIGLPALTLGIVSGLFVGARSAPGLRGAWQQYVALGVWAVFAAVLVLRVVAGWRGRRAAIGTIIGFASALTVLGGYLLRGPT
jgi:ABC-type transport system involved in cytochrome c biogenesis permease subunit